LLHFPQCRFERGLTFFPPSRPYLAYSQHIDDSFSETTAFHPHGNQRARCNPLQVLP
jgi:hypothetical protein